MISWDTQTSNRADFNLIFLFPQRLAWRMELPVIRTVRVWELAALQTVIWRMVCATWLCPPRLKVLRGSQPQQQQRWWPQPRPRPPTRQPPPAQPPRHRHRDHAAVDVCVPRTTRAITTTTWTMNTSWQLQQDKLSPSPSILLHWKLQPLAITTRFRYSRALVQQGLYYSIRPAGRRRQCRAP